MELLQAFEFGDILWAVIWFFIGLFVFKYPPAKKLCDVISIAVSVYGFYGIATQPDLLAIYIDKVPLSYVIGIITHHIYLVGANISRAEHMRAPFAWGRVIFYFFAIILLSLLARYVLFPKLS
jgi:hypothetical protein